jgi:peptidyl-tRNA hydrolase, PTH1 family
MKFETRIIDAGFFVGANRASHLFVIITVISRMKFLIAGLGNAGEEYANTRHNIGFDVVAAFVQKHSGTFTSGRLAYVAEIKWKGKTCVCICPVTFMNLSGKAVKYWMDKEKIPLENILIVVDDLALPITKLRLRPTGSSAGHNGLKSIEESLGTQAYAKLRFGIGSNYPKGRQIDFVLGKWDKDETPVVRFKIQKAVEAIEAFVSVGIARAMTEINNKEFSL